MARDIAGVKEEARLVGGFVEARGSGQGMFFVPDLSAIAKLHPDESLAVAGKNPTAFFGLLQGFAREADADPASSRSEEPDALIGLAWV